MFPRKKLVRNMGSGLKFGGTPFLRKNYLKFEVLICYLKWLKIYNSLHYSESPIHNEAVHRFRPIWCHISLLQGCSFCAYPYFCIPNHTSVVIKLERISQTGFWWLFIQKQPFEMIYCQFQVHSLIFVTTATDMLPLPPKTRIPPKRRKFH